MQVKVLNSIRKVDLEDRHGAYDEGTIYEFHSFYYQMSEYLISDFSHLIVALCCYDLTAFL
jgi:hypothetical protein